MDAFHCPICQKVVVETVLSFPFCSQRCRLVDLGKWLREDYRVSRPLGPSALIEEAGEAEESSPEETEDVGG